ncbi:hypothetical protein EVAR_32932_1 [Eumeta japonica]|uniref:RNA-directed DNA polymerase from transposon BS n=1 Tax=Eumeta variegata TaxID=151549 RepID=A0A4C1X2R6_EUMVA|nr:hypothetical protein EVAR_32932_1 [Eumeta japonica]
MATDESFDIKHGRHNAYLVKQFRLVFHDDEKAKYIADGLQNQCTNSAQPNDQRHLYQRDRIVAQLLNSSLSFNLFPITADKLNACIRNLHSKKASRLDDTSNGLFKLLPPNLLLIHLTIFNICVNKAIFLDLWKNADVIGIPKLGKS